MHVAVAAAYFATAFCFMYIVLHLLFMVAMAAMVAICLFSIVVILSKRNSLR